MNTVSMTINGQFLAGIGLKIFAEGKILDGSIPSWEKNIFRFILAWLDDVDSIIQYSSGTTGKSRELHLLKTSLLRSAENTCRFFDLKKYQTAVLCLPIEYIAGKMMVVRCIVGGLNLQMVEPDSMPDLSGIGKIDFCAMVPLQVLNTLKNNHDLSGVKKLLIGGAEISPELESLVNNISTEVYASYGMAETCSHVALRRLNGAGAQIFYNALPGVALSHDERGCMVITADYLPEQIITNDLVEFSGYNTFRWLGRYDNLINSGGIKIVPEEMESVISAKTGIECALVGIPDPLLGQKTVLVIEKKSSLLGIDLSSQLDELFPRNRQPREIVQIDAFPRNESYKLDRRKLAGMVCRIL